MFNYCNICLVIYLCFYKSICYKKCDYKDNFVAVSLIQQYVHPLNDVILFLALDQSSGQLDESMTNQKPEKE